MNECSCIMEEKPNMCVVYRQSGRLFDCWEYVIAADYYFVITTSRTQLVNLFFLTTLAPLHYCTFMAS